MLFANTSTPYGSWKLVQLRSEIELIEISGKSSLLFKQPHTPRRPYGIWCQPTIARVRYSQGPLYIAILPTVTLGFRLFGLDLFSVYSVAIADLGYSGPAPWHTYLDHPPQVKLGVN